MKTVAYLRVFTGGQELNNQRLAILDYAHKHHLQKQRYTTKNNVGLVFMIRYFFIILTFSQPLLSMEVNTDDISIDERLMEYCQAVGKIDSYAERAAESAVAKNTYILQNPMPSLRIINMLYKDTHSCLEEAIIVAKTLGIKRERVIEEFMKHYNRKMRH